MKMKNGWKVIELANQYNVSKQMIFNYINEMKEQKIKGFELSGNQFLINQDGYNYILQKRQGVTERVKKLNENIQNIQEENNLEQAILQNKIEYLEKALADAKEHITKLEYEVKAKDDDLKASQQNYIELTNKTLGLLLPEGTQEQPKKKKWWWQR